MNPGATTGMPLPCCALLRWLIQIDREKLLPQDYAGYLPKVTLQYISNELDDLLSQWPPIINSPYSV